MTALNPWLIAPTEHGGWLRSLSEYNRRPLVGYNFIAGMVPSNNGTDATNDLDFTAGACVSNNGNVFPISATTKRIDATFAAGSGNGGLASGLTASNTSYHAFALWGPKTRNSDVGFDTSLTAANLIADSVAVKLGLTEYRRVFSFYRTGGANVVFKAYELEGGGLCVRLDVPTQVTNSNPGTSAILVTHALPTGVQLDWIGSFVADNRLGTTGKAVLLTSPDQTDTAASGTVLTVGVAAGIQDYIFCSYRTNTSAQTRMRWSASEAAVGWSFQTDRWIDHRVS